MALRLIEEHKVLEHRQVRLPDGEALVRILLDAEQDGGRVSPPRHEPARDQ